MESSLNEARQSIDTSIDTATKPPPDPFAHDADGIPIAPPVPAIETSNLNGSHAGEAPAADDLGRDHDPNGRRAAPPGREEWRLKG